VRSFLNASVATKLFRWGEYRKRYHEKKVIAHPETKLSVLYSHAGAEDWFLLDFFIVATARNHEAYGCQIRRPHEDCPHHQGKAAQDTHCRNQRLADNINKRRKSSKSELLFPQRAIPPGQTSAENPTRCLWIIDTSFGKKIYIRWCCIKLLSPPGL
jgi:hypothetical protein